MNYDERQKFEHELIDRKLTWLLSSQTILFAALALVFGKDNKESDRFFLTILLSSVGIAISLLISVGVFMGIRAKRQSFEKEIQNQKDNHPVESETNPVQWGQDTKITKIAVYPDKFMPLVFALAWLIILVRQLLTH